MKWGFIPFILFCLSTMLFADWSDKQRIEFSSGMWSFSFSVSLQVNQSGAITAAITDLQPANQKAWASISLSTQITNVEKRFNGIHAYITIRFNGVSNHYSQELESGKETWGPPTAHAEKTWKEGVFVAINHDQIPDQLDIESIPNETDTDLPLDQDQDDPLCDPKSRLDEKSTIREEFTDRSFIKFKKGQVQVQLVGCRTWRAAPNNMTLKPGDRIKTGSNGRASIALGNGGSIKIKPNSEMLIPEITGNTVERISFIELAIGVLWAHAKKEKNSLKIATPHSICGVRGTEFEIIYRDATSCVKALKQSVWFSDKLKRKTVIVREGEMSCIHGNGLPSDSSPIHNSQQNSNVQSFLIGKWSSSFGTITFHQQGNKITGNYTHDNGKIEGRLDGNIFRGKWSEAPTYKSNDDTGYMELTFSRSGKTFTGHWRYGFTGNTWNGTWSGKFVGK